MNQKEILHFIQNRPKGLRAYDDWFNTDMDQILTRGIRIKRLRIFCVGWTDRAGKESVQYEVEHQTGRRHHDGRIEWFPNGYALAVFPGSDREMNGAYRKAKRHINQLRKVWAKRSKKQLSQELESKNWMFLVQ